MDAKYKRYDRHGVSSGEVHQLLTYIAGYTPGGAPTVVIVHPQQSGCTHRALRIDGPRGRLGTVHVLGVDVEATAERAIADLQRVLEGIHGA